MDRRVRFLIIGITVIILFKILFDSNNNKKRRIKNYKRIDFSDIENPTITSMLKNVYSFKRNCYEHPKLNDEIINTFALDDILDNYVKPIGYRNIFFLDTTCPETKMLKFNPYQMCAIESATLLNKGAKIFVIFTSPRCHLADIQSEFPITFFDTYYKINFRNLNLWKFVKGTAAEQWFNKDTLFASENLELHMEEFLSYLIFLRYNGIYMPLNIINLKSLMRLPKNFITPRKYSAMSIEKNLALEFLNDFMKNFNSSEWNPNEAKERVLRNFCNVADIEELEEDGRCGNMKIILDELFDPIDDSVNLFTNEKTNEILNNTLKNVYMLPLWELQDLNLDRKNDFEGAYYELAKIHCPKTFETMINFNLSLI